MYIKYLPTLGKYLGTYYRELGLGPRLGLHVTLHHLVNVLLVQGSGVWYNRLYHTRYVQVPTLDVAARVFAVVASDGKS